MALRIRITGRIDTLDDGRKVTRRTVRYINDDGVECFKTDVPTAERILHAMKGDETSMDDLAGALDRALSKLAPTERKRKAVSEEEVLVDAE